MGLRNCVLHCSIHRMISKTTATPDPRPRTRDRRPGVPRPADGTKDPGILLRKRGQVLRWRKRTITIRKQQRNGCNAQGQSLTLKLGDL